MRARAFGPVPFAILCAACASAPETKPRHLAVAPAMVIEEPHYVGGIPRPVIDDALQAGLGRFLGHVDVQAVLDAKRKFIGWRVLALRPASTWKDVGLEVGDIVTTVNGFPVGRIEEAEAAFRSLGVSSEIRVSYLRGGEPSELRVQILDAGPAPTTSASSPPAAKLPPIAN